MNAGLSRDDNPPADRSVARLVNEYFDRRQAGEDLTPETFVAEHPTRADELRPYLEGLALIDRARSTAGVGEPGPQTAFSKELPAIPGYELLEELGRGGMGVVYKARQLATQRTVAVKLMLAGPFASPAARQRFAREVVLAARLDHPGIVRILEGGTVAGQPYYAMDFVDGVRVDHFLAKRAADVPAVLQLFTRICEAAEAAHSQGVVHRDLKPANVLVDKQGYPHILDFGLAKALGQANDSGSLYRSASLPGLVVGTLAYLAPEQAAGLSTEVDSRTDVYALGVMLYEALTGKPPIDVSGRPSEVIQRILESAPRPPTTISPHVHRELETILLKALSKDKADRYPSARALGEDLRRHLAGDPILAHRPSRLYVFRKKLGKHRLQIAFGAAAFVVAALGLWGGLSWVRHVRQQRAAAERYEARHEALRAQHSLEAYGPPAAGGAAEALLARWPELSEGHLLVAQVQFRAGQVDVAIVQLERRLAARPDDWAAQALLSEVYRAVGNTQRAEDLAAMAERGAPDSAEGWHLRSLATLSLQDALGYAEQAVQRDASFVLGWARLAYLNICLNHLDGALRACDQLVALEPQMVRWGLLRAEVLLRRGEIELALGALADTARKSSAPDSVCELRAVAYRRLRRYDLALADYERILAAESAEPGTIPIWHRYQRATPLWISGRLEEAIADYRRVRAVLGGPHYADARLAIILRELGRRAEAEDVLQTALREGHDPWLAKIFACLAGALSPAELAQAADGDTLERRCEAYYYAGEACLLAGEREQARVWFEKCVQTGVVFDPDVLHPVPMCEYELAEWRLQVLSAGRQPTFQSDGN